MHILWLALRSVLAVLAGIFVTSIVSFAIEIPVLALASKTLPQTFPDRAALEVSVAWMLSQWLYTAPALVLGGYVAAWLAPGRGLAHAAAMAIVQELLIVALIFNPPHPVPPWMWLLTLTLAPLAILCGGYLRTRHRGQVPLTSGQR